MQYSILIQWSTEDNVYVVSFPEFNRGIMARGKTVEEAAKNGREALEALIEDLQENDVLLPTPNTYPAFSVEQD